ncbi:hypothetical protein PFISCL1PPCAC_29007, partial [Pristionchus fissidentatus]
ENRLARESALFAHLEYHIAASILSLCVTCRGYKIASSHKTNFVALTTAFAVVLSASVLERPIEGNACRRLYADPLRDNRSAWTVSSACHDRYGFPPSEFKSWFAHLHASVATAIGLSTFGFVMCGHFQTFPSRVLLGEYFLAAQPILFLANTLLILFNFNNGFQKFDKLYHKLFDYL